MLTPVHLLPDHPRLAERPLVVMALCADWCGTCREFQDVLSRIAHAHPELLFAWADIEDDAELVGDIDVDDFPTLAIFRAGQALHFGASLPLEAVVVRLLESLARTSSASTPVPSAVAEFGKKLAR